MKKKLAIISLMLILVITSLVTTVNASSFSATLTPNKTTVPESNEFVVTVRISNLDVGTTGINIFADIVQITFKTKTGVTGKSGDIKLTDIQASNTGETITAAPISTKITIGSAPSGNEIGNNSNQPTNTNKAPNQIQQRNTNTNTSGNIVRNIVNNTNTNTNTRKNTVYEDDIPYTGASDNIMVAIFVVLVIAGISYFKYESIKEK